ncbi:hypothetical protein J2T04_001009 [Chryseobacterium lathyri]|uniref:Uncharacterized protein n=1 Tax=Chryseobacterium lathyri TaxID=395933 RepID=A0ABT9SL17_9FLAO|nr:hypothetical protein [Chryseobacterium lathyri]
MQLFKSNFIHKKLPRREAKNTNDEKNPVETG